ncbi:MAG: Rpn family recombination-promoting nuclease/putative transposase, partial [Myxococcota bacterium]
MTPPDDNGDSSDDKADIAHHPHDGLVKRIFGDPQTAAVELRKVLPAALCERLDWDILHVESSSFIDPKLKPRHSDILYTIAIVGSERRISLYTVLEHQSKPDAKMAARFIVYVGRLYERYIRQHKDSTTVPLVVPVLLYQGPTGWTLPRRLSESLDAPPELLEIFPSPVELVFAVDDLEESVLGQQVTRDMLVRDRHLAQAEMARTMLWLYHHPEASTGERAAALGLLLEFIAETWGPDAVRPFLTYLLSAFPTQTPIRAIIE